MLRFFRNNGLSLVLFVLFFFTLIVGQSLVGHREYNNDQREHGQPAVAYAEYLATTHFLEATMENWESEFLQMYVFIVLTVFLYQKGSAESKDPDRKEAVDRDPRDSRNKLGVPWPVRRGGFILKLYENSLSLAFLFLFFLSFFLHAVGGAGEYISGLIRTRRGGRAHLSARLHGHFALLVRVAAKLAERIPRHRHDGRADDLAAPERLARIQTR